VSAAVGDAEDRRSRGLSEAEAAIRLKAEGPNTLPEADRRSFARIVLEILREPMFALLLGAAMIYFILGDLKEALVLGVFASTSVLIALVQEARTERVLESLRDLTSPRALVIRGSEEKRIAGAELVRGDLVILGEGDRVPADATVLSAHDLLCDEALLTGEAVPVRKIADPDASPSGRPGGDDLPYVYSGSLVVRGRGRAEVTATGPRSEIGKIGLAITRIDTEPPRLRLQTRRLVRNFAAVVTVWRCEPSSCSPRPRQLAPPRAQAFIPPVYRPCRRDTWLRATPGSSALPNIQRRPSSGRCSNSDRRSGACGLRRVPQRRVRSRR
jgi:Ca2+-transporting ATPase